MPFSTQIEQKQGIYSAAHAVSSGPVSRSELDIIHSSYPHFFHISMCHVLERAISVCSEAIDLNCEVWTERMWADKNNQQVECTRISLQRNIVEREAEQPACTLFTIRTQHFFPQSLRRRENMCIQYHAFWQPRNGLTKWIRSARTFNHPFVCSGPKTKSSALIPRRRNGKNITWKIRQQKKNKLLNSSVSSRVDGEHDAFDVASNCERPRRHL